MRKEDYIKILTDQIRCKKARAGIEQEILGHMEEQETFFLSEGMEKTEAELEAVKEMGDPVEVGNAMDRIHRPRMAWGMIGLIAVLYVAGAVLRYALQLRFEEASIYPGYFMESGIETLIREGLQIAGGMAVLIGVCYADYSRIGRKAREITALLFLILFPGILMFGTDVNGAVYGIYGLPVNVRMVVLLFVPLYGGILYHYRGGYKNLFKSIGWMLPGLLCSLRIPSLTTTILLFFTYTTVLSVAVWKGLYQVHIKRTLTLIWSCVLAMPVLGFLVIWFRGAEYQVQRLQFILNPAATAAGYVTSSLRSMLADCQLIGSGPDLSEMTKWAGIDYLLSYVMGCYGILATVALVAGMVILFMKLLRVSTKQKNQLGMMMGVGCGMYLMVQLAFYLLQTMGIFNIGYIYCPFLNYGDSGMIITNILLGLLLSIYRYQDVPLNQGMARQKPRVS